jgi:uncharacterized protein YggE
MSNTNIGNKRTLGLIAGILAMSLVAASIAGGRALSAAAQQNPTDPMPVDLGCPTGAEVCEETIVSTSGTSTVKVNPDKVSVTIGVETRGQSAEEAATSNAEAMEKVLQSLRDLGIADNQIRTNWYSVEVTALHRDLSAASRVRSKERDHGLCSIQQRNSDAGR